MPFFVKKSTIRGSSNQKCNVWSVNVFQSALHSSCMRFFSSFHVHKIATFVNCHQKETEKIDVNVLTNQFISRLKLIM